MFFKKMSYTFSFFFRPFQELYICARTLLHLKKLNYYTNRANLLTTVMKIVHKYMMKAERAETSLLM